MAAARKLLLIGIDSLEFDYLEAALGELPCLRRLHREGQITRLHNTADMLNASVWPTFFTGRSPGEHGLYFPMQWDPATMRLRRIDGEWLPTEPFWYRLERRGCRVAAVDIPMVRSTDLEHGVEIHNWRSQSFSRLHVNRSSLHTALSRATPGEHAGLEPDIPVPKNARRLLRTKGDLIAGAQAKGEFLRSLYASEPWDFFVVAFAEFHRAGHYFWGEPAATDAAPRHLIDVLRGIDTAVATLLRAVDPATTTIGVFSLHGMGPNGSYAHVVPEVLDRLHRRLSQTDPEFAVLASTHRGLVRTLREWVPAPLQLGVALAVSEPVRDWVAGRTIDGGRDWTRTFAFPLPSGTEGLIRFNARGRESAGVLDKSSLVGARYLEHLRRAFLELRREDTGHRVVADVVEPPFRYPGPRAQWLPDVAILWDDTSTADTIYGPTVGRIVSRQITGRTGNHSTSPGFCLWTGADEGERSTASWPADIADFAAFSHEYLQSS